MTFNYSDVEQNGIFIEAAPRKSEKRINSPYQNDFIIRCNGLQLEATIFANQPIYASEDGKKFELPPKELAEMMGYASFSIKRIELNYLNCGKKEEIKGIEQRLLFMLGQEKL